jgi:hypothetical protein
VALVKSHKFIDEGSEIKFYPLHILDSHKKNNDFLRMDRWKDFTRPSLVYGGRLPEDVPRVVNYCLSQQLDLIAAIHTTGKGLKYG